jgi:hypothetical protein
MRLFARQCKHIPQQRAVAQTRHGGDGGVDGGYELREDEAKIVQRRQQRLSKNRFGGERCDDEDGGDGGCQRYRRIRRS